MPKRKKIEPGSLVIVKRGIRWEPAIYLTSEYSEFLSKTIFRVLWFDPDPQGYFDYINKTWTAPLSLIGQVRNLNRPSKKLYDRIQAQNKKKRRWK